MCFINEETSSINKAAILITFSFQLLKEFLLVVNVLLAIDFYLYSCANFLQS